MDELVFRLCTAYRVHSAMLPLYTMRNDPQVEALNVIGDAIRRRAAEIKVTEAQAWTLYNEVIARETAYRLTQK